MAKQRFFIWRIQKSEMALCAEMMVTTEPWLTLGRKRKTVLALLSDPEKEVYVAKSGSHLSGVIVLCMTGAFAGYIQAICVASEFRGQGIGSRLIEFAERRIFSESPNVFLLVSSFNRRAQKLYRRLGFQKVGELPDYVVTGHSEFLMRKTIGPLDDFPKRR